MIYLASAVAFLLGVLLAIFITTIRADDRAEEVSARHDVERKEWAAERRDLNNRIQVPEAAPFMTPTQPGPPPLQHVPFDDDEAFLKSQEEVPEWP